MSAIELKPFCKDAEVAIAGGDLILTLTVDFAFIDRVEGIFRPRQMPELISELFKSLSMQTKFLWQMTRKHHSDLSLDQIAGIQFSEDGPAVIAVLGALIRDTFNWVDDDGEGEQGHPPPKRSNGASRASAKSGSRPVSIRKPSGKRRPARS